MRVRIVGRVQRASHDGTVPHGEYSAAPGPVSDGNRRPDTGMVLTAGRRRWEVQTYDWHRAINSGAIIEIEEGEMSNLPVKVEQHYDVFSVMDKLDDEIIQAELENRVVSTWVYSFKGDNGQPQSGLSKKGVDEACTEMAKKGHIIEEEGVEFAPCPISKEHVLFKAKVRRILVNADGTRVPMECVYGTKRQWIKDTRKNGPPVEDKFWFEKGAAKALRNARSRLIPAEIQAAIIALAGKSGKVRKIDEPSQSKTNPDEASKELKGKLMDMSKAKFGDKAMDFIKWCQGHEKYWTTNMVNDLIVPDNFNAQAALFEDSQRAA